MNFCFSLTYFSQFYIFILFLVQILENKYFFEDKYFFCFWILESVFFCFFGLGGQRQAVYSQSAPNIWLVLVPDFPYLWLEGLWSRKCHTFSGKDANLSEIKKKLMVTFVFLSEVQNQLLSTEIPRTDQGDMTRAHKAKHYPAGLQLRQLRQKMVRELR